MKIALIAPPFISVPPKKYGGTELFIAELAEGLQQEGVEVVVYTIGESTVNVPKKWRYEKENWPVCGDPEANLKSLSHSAWAVNDAAADADVIHLNNAPGLCFSQFVKAPFVYTLHHAYEKHLVEYYGLLPDVRYVSISEFQRQALGMRQARTIHHGLRLSRYQLQETKQHYLSFLGRIAPDKGTHLAIEIAKQAGIPLRIAGEIQPIYREYWEQRIQPLVDGTFIQYVGEVGLAEKNALLGGSLAMLFPVQWEEPFGLVMIEAMACGTPVLAMPGGSVSEIIQEGVNGCVRETVSDLANCAKDLKFKADEVRRYAEQNFALERMVREYIKVYSEIIDARGGRAEELSVA